MVSEFLVTFCFPSFNLFLLWRFIYFVGEVALQLINLMLSGTNKSRFSCSLRNVHAYRKFWDIILKYICSPCILFLIPKLLISSLEPTSCICGKLYCCD